MKKSAKTKFIKDRLYCNLPEEDEYIMRYKKYTERHDAVWFEPVVNCNFSKVDGLVPFSSYNDFRRAFHWSDLLTPADRQQANLKVDPLNGKFEDEILRHLAARRAKLRKLTAILGGEYYAQC